jgi:hypothetical protein
MCWGVHAAGTETFELFLVLFVPLEVKYRLNMCCWSIMGGRIRRERSLIVGHGLMTVKGLLVDNIDFLGPYDAFSPNAYCVVDVHVSIFFPRFDLMYCCHCCLYWAPNQNQTNLFDTFLNNKSLSLSA